MSTRGVGLTPGVAAALGVAAIPISKVGPRRHERLSGGERELYFWVLRRFAASGRPSGAETRETAGRLGLDADSALKTSRRTTLFISTRLARSSWRIPFLGVQRSTGSGSQEGTK